MQVRVINLESLGERTWLPGLTGTELQRIHGEHVGRHRGQQHAAGGGLQLRRQVRLQRCDGVGQQQLCEVQQGSQALRRVGDPCGTEMGYITTYISLDSGIAQYPILCYVAWR